MEIENKLLKFRQESNLRTPKKEETSMSFFGILKYISDNVFQSNNERSNENFKSFTDSRKVPRDAGVRPRLTKRRTLEKIDEVDEHLAHSEIETNETIPKLNYIQIALKTLLWLVLFAIFIKLEFGVVYFVVSLIIIIYMNTNIGNKQRGLSAYSVFNPNLERIHGTLTPEQVEKSIIGSF